MARISGCHDHHRLRDSSRSFRDTSLPIGSLMSGRPAGGGATVRPAHPRRRRPVNITEAGATENDFSGGHAGSDHGARNRRIGALPGGGTGCAFWSRVPPAQTTTRPESAAAAPARPQDPRRGLPVGAEVTPGGVHLRVWAPARRRVEVVSASGGVVAALEREAGGSGYFSGFVEGLPARALFPFPLAGGGAYPAPANS